MSEAVVSTVANSAMTASPLDLPMTQIWVYLSGSPLFALIVTLLAYQVGLTIYLKLNRNPLANPVAIAVCGVASILLLLDMPYATYFEGAQFVHFLLGTATVSLATHISRLYLAQASYFPIVACFTPGGYGLCDGRSRCRKPDGGGCCDSWSHDSQIGHRADCDGGR